jgi:hypothetical protein
MRHSRVHFHNRSSNVHLHILDRARFWDWDIGQWFTPPKSKSIWEAMTTGSTGGKEANSWFSPFTALSMGLNKYNNKGNDDKGWANWLSPNKGILGSWTGKVGTAALGAIPYVGPFVAAGAGAMGSTGYGGFQGTDSGWGKGTMDTIGGAIGGYGMGSIGSGVGGAVGGAAKSGLSGIGSGFSQGISNYGATTAAPFKAMGSGMSGSGAAASPAYMGGYGSAMPAGTTWAAGSGAGAGAAGGAAGGILGSNLGSNANAFNSMYAAQNPNYGNIMGAFNPYGASSQAAGGAAKAAGGIDWGQVAGGLGVSMIPSMMGGEKTQIPQSQLYGEATSRLLGGKGLSDIGQLGREALTSNLSGEFSPASDEYFSAATRRLNESYDKAEKDFTTQFQSIRPGSDVGGDSAYREGINKIRIDRARENAGIAAELDYRRESDYMDRRYQEIQSALNVDQQTMNNYLALAQMEDNNLALNTGITLGEAAQFKEIFGNLGEMMMQRGVGLNDPTKALQSLMGGR